jgi:hypothetical protein
VRTAFAVVAAGAAFVVSAPPAAAYPPWVLAIRDCADDGKLDHTYSHDALVKALHNVPSDGGEYTDCANEISRALTGGSGKTDGPRVNGVLSPSGAIAASDDDLAQLQRVVAAVDAGEPAPVTVVAASSSAASSTAPRSTDTTLADLDSASAPYRLDLKLLVLVTAMGMLALISAGVAEHARRRGGA